MECDADPKSKQNERWPLAPEYRKPCDGAVRRYKVALQSDPQAACEIVLCAGHAAIQRTQRSLHMEVI